LYQSGSDLANCWREIITVGVVNIDDQYQYCNKVLLSTKCRLS